jgi:hypothetical protein
MKRLQIIAKEPQKFATSRSWEGMVVNSYNWTVLSFKFRSENGVDGMSMTLDFPQEEKPKLTAQEQAELTQHLKGMAAAKLEVNEIWVG